MKNKENLVIVIAVVLAICMILTSILPKDSDYKMPLMLSMLPISILFAFSTFMFLPSNK